MKYSFTTLALSAVASAGIIQQRSCSFTLTASGGESGTLGQLSDGQNRVGGGLATATYTIANSSITDSSGRGCILTPPTTQFQCDTGATPTPGFSIGSSGTVSYEGNTTFYACPASDTEYNIYTVPVSGQTKCVEVGLTASGCYNSGSSSASSASAATNAASAKTSAVEATSAKSSAVVATSAKSTPVTVASSAKSSAVVATSAKSTPVVVASSAKSSPVGATSAKTSPITATQSSESTCAVAQTVTLIKTVSSSSCTGGSTVTVTSIVTASGEGSGASTPVSASKAATVTAGSGSGSGASTPVSSKVATETAGSGSGSGASTPVSSKVATATAGSGSGASTQGSGTKPSTTGSSTASTTSSACAANLSGSYQYPHLIVPVSSSSPNTAYGTSYNGEINSTTSSIFNFDIPTSYTGTCSLVFLFPTQSELETSSYTFSGNGEIDFTQLSTVATTSTTYSSQGSVETNFGVKTVTPGTSTVVATFACQAGKAVSYELSSASGTSLTFFQDYNPSPIGLYITSC